MSPARLKRICTVCGHVATDELPTGEQCRSVRYSGRCVGKYHVPSYRVFDLARKQWLCRAPSQPYTTLEDYAGIYASDEIDFALEFAYGTSERSIVARRATIILVK